MTQDTTLSNSSVPSGPMVILPARLDIYTTGDLWTPCLKQLKNNKQNDITIDASAVEFCDAAGAAFLLSLKQYHAPRHTHIANLKPHFQELLNEFEQQANNRLTPEVKVDAFTQAGHKTLGVMKEFFQNIAFAGELFSQLFKGNKNKRYLRWNDVLEFIEKVGPNALPITALLGFLFGLILSFQGVIPLQNFGADIYIIRLVGTSIIRELAPLIVAIIIIARTASAFAAEIGTMKINQEVDALVTMGIEPLRYLVMPRVLAVVIVMPALTVFLILFSFIGCYVVSSSLGYNFHIFINELYQSFDYVNILNSILKSIVFGLLVASIGCMHGLKTRVGALAVGESTTNAVVSGIVILTITDGIFSVIFYWLGI